MSGIKDENFIKAIAKIIDTWSGEWLKPSGDSFQNRKYHG
jgi:hypothetical protein